MAQNNCGVQILLLVARIFEHHTAEYIVLLGERYEQNISHHGSDACNDDGTNSAAATVTSAMNGLFETLLT